MATLLLFVASASSATNINLGIDTYVDSYTAPTPVMSSGDGPSGPGDYTVITIPALDDVCFGLPGLACGSATTVDPFDGKAPAAGSDNSDSGWVAGDDLYGVKWDTNIGLTSSVNEGLLWFDISAAELAAYNAASNAVATLQYNVADNGSAGNLYRMTTDWLSGPSGGNSATWNSIGGGVIPGTNALTTSTQLLASTDGGTFTADVTADVSAWASGASSNFGWGIEAAGGTRARLNTFENPDDALKPTLILQKQIAGTSFEVPATGTTDFTAAGGELGFTATVVGTGVHGVQDKASSEATGTNPAAWDPAPDGNQVFEATGTGGSTTQSSMSLVFDTVDLSSETGVSFSIDLFMETSNWEADDIIKIALETFDGTDTIDLVLLDNNGVDPDVVPEITEGAWRTYTAQIEDSILSAILKIDTSSNSNSLEESVFFDNIRFLGDLQVEPLPEPSTGLLLGLALVGLAARPNR